MAEDYLTDDEQFEAIKQAFVEYAPWIAGGVLGGAALIFGYRHYVSLTEHKALNAAVQFSVMTSAVQANDPAKARQTADGLIKDYASSPYADQARLMLARLDVDGGDPGKAAASLTQVMSGSKDTELRHVAALRLARILIDQGKTDEAIKTLADPIPPAFAAPYHEARGDAYVAKKDSARAIAEYQAALSATDISGINASLLELKIQDLGAPPAPAVKTASADTSNKVKP